MRSVSTHRRLGVCLLAAILSIIAIYRYRSSATGLQYQRDNEQQSSRAQIGVPPVHHATGAPMQAATSTAQFVTSIPPTGVDPIQYAALVDGYFSNNNRLPSLYSSAEARLCLAGKRIVFAGDSYSLEHFLALVDLLSGEASNKEFLRSGMRQSALQAAKLVVDAKLRPMEIELDWQCSEHHLCYGASGRLNACVDCLAALDADIVMVSAGVHLLRAKNFWSKENHSMMLKDIVRAWDEVPNIIWGSVPNFRRQSIPYPYNESMPLPALEHIYVKTRQLAKSRGMKFMDFYILTRACEWENCTADGGHRARFVNRIKAQLFLHQVCAKKPRDLETLESSHDNDLLVAKMLDARREFEEFKKSKPFTWTYLVT